MRLRNLSIRTILGLIIGFMGLLAMILALASGELLQQQAYQNQRLSMQKLIRLKSDDLLAELSRRSRDLGSTLQKGKEFEAAFDARDSGKLGELLGVQFHDFYVTTGILKLEGLHVLETDLRPVAQLLADGSRFNLFDASCASLIQRASSRAGPERMKILSGECLQAGHPYHIVLQPVGGLRLKGYLAVVTDPTHNLLRLESALGMPLTILLPDRTLLYQSRQWPGPRAMPDVLVAELQLLSEEAEPALILAMADDVRTLRQGLPQTGMLVMAGVFFITLICMLLVMWVLRVTTTRPLQALSDHLRRVHEDREQLGKPIQIRGSKELRDLAASLNDMSSDLAHANQELLQEVAIRKQAEAELRAHQDELEKLVELRTKDLEEARDQALQASQAKSSFIANVSHEIRTPLTPIIGFAESILQDNPDTETRNALLNSIIRNGRHLFNIINEILDLSKIEADRLEIEKIDVDLSQLYQDIDAVIGVLAREKGLEFHKAFTSPVPRRIHSDPTRLKQILMNLLTNAVKFTERGHIGLYCEFEPEAGRLNFTVTDTGIGIPQDKLDRLFKAFSQADASTTRRYGGTGLGLYISQRLARLLGGDIAVQSLEGFGTKFTVSIAAEGVDMADLIRSPDLALARASYEAGLPTAIPRLAGHVLLAEDSADNQRLISHYIGKTGARVSTADNGQIALEMALAHDYDLVLMDMQMPLMSGEEAVELLRASGCATPIVALTANAMKGDREKYARIGCDDFLGKPIRQRVFYKVLAKHLPAADAAGAAPSAGPGLEEDAEFLELRAGFLASLDGFAARLRQAMAGDDHAEAAEEAHKLKGLGGSFGYPEITELAARLESALKAGQLDEASPLCAGLCDLIEQCGLAHRKAA